MTSRASLEKNIRTLNKYIILMNGITVVSLIEIIMYAFLRLFWISLFFLILGISATLIKEICYRALMNTYEVLK